MPNHRDKRDGKQNSIHQSKVISPLVRFLFHCIRTHLFRHSHPLSSILSFGHPLQTYANGLRFVLTILGGTIAVMGSRVIGYTSAGALGCVTMAFIARIGWRREEAKLTPEQLQAQQIVSTNKRNNTFFKIILRFSN